MSSNEVFVVLDDNFDIPLYLDFRVIGRADDVKGQGCGVVARSTGWVARRQRIVQAASLFGSGLSGERV